MAARAFRSFCLWAVFAAALGASGSRAEHALVADLDRIFHAPPMDQGLWAVEVKSLASGRVLYALNARKLMMPASNMKILTLATAAVTLGWDHRFTTSLATSAPIANGALTGDLIVVGGGDPTINGRENRAAAFFDQCAAALNAAGVSRIEGNIVADAGAFDRNGLGPGWSWDYLQFGYAAPVSALELDENTATLTVRPGARPGDQAALELPPGTGLGLIHRVRTSEPGAAANIVVERAPNDRWLDVSGSIAVDATPLTRQIAVAAPALYFVHSLLNALVARGIDVRGLPRDMSDAQGTPTAAGPRRVLFAAQSPPLRDVAVTMMKASQNLYAETLLKAAGAARSGGIGTTDAGRAAARDLLASWGIPATYVQADGSGLSRYDFVTAEMLVAVLERLYTDPRHRDPFMASLPIAGRDGTIEARMKGTRAEGNALAKTGSIANVRALSGYVRTRRGEMLAFSILANSFAIPAATVTWIADVAVETLANYAGQP